MRIAFVEPRTTRYNVFSKYMNLPLLGPVYLASMLLKAGHEITIYNENLMKRDVMDRELDCDMLLVSGLTTTIQRGYDIAMRYRRIRPSGKVIIGGIHATFHPKEAGRYADHVIIGEGEDVILEVVSGKVKSKYVHSKGLIDMEKLPNPDFSLLKNNQRISPYPYMTSRGCPFGCTFCTVTRMFGRGYRTKSIGKVIDELTSLGQQKIFFYDDNFTANNNRSIELLTRLKKRDLGLKWTAQVRTDVTKNPKLMKLMAESGCTNVYVGFESVNEKSLQRLNKGQTVFDIRRSIKAFHDHGIGVHGMFMFGVDDDDRSVFRRTLNFANRNSIDSVQFMIFTPIPGTPVYDDFNRAGRILHNDWSLYDGMHCVHKPANMTPYELQSGTVDAYREFYSYARAMNEALNMVFDYSVNSIRALYTRVYSRSFNRFFYRMVGNNIVRNWIKTNREFMANLQRHYHL